MVSKIVFFTFFFLPIFDSKHVMFITILCYGNAGKVVLGIPVKASSLFPRNPREAFPPFNTGQEPFDCLQSIELV